MSPPWNKQKWRNVKNKNKNKNEPLDNNKKNKTPTAEIFSFEFDNKSNKNLPMPMPMAMSMSMPLSMLLGQKSSNIFDSILKKIEKDNTKNNILKKPTFIIDNNKTYTELDIKIDSIDDLIELGKLYKENHNYPIDLKKVNDIIPILEKFKNVIGMKEAKKNIVKQIIYFISCIDDNKNMLHTAITGPPGIGKTMLGHIIGEIYYKLGVVNGSEYKFKKVRRADLIGEYMGHTAMKTQAVIDECCGGVLFIDEAYSLGSGEKKDIYSKECIDTINQNLTENKNNFVCIIAGYKDDLEKCFFSINEGLKRRFPFRYNIEKYDSKELTHILLHFIKQEKWLLDDTIKFDDLEDFIKTNYNHFPNFGGDIENYFFNVRIVHAFRTLGKLPKYKKKITMDDFKNGMEVFLQSKEKVNNDFLHMYL
jgi:SpoVK/Ycf46/Vps4 family AAA+-type ATPase